MCFELHRQIPQAFGAGRGKIRRAKCRQVLLLATFHSYLFRLTIASLFLIEAMNSAMNK